MIIRIFRKPTFWFGFCLLFIPLIASIPSFQNSWTIAVISIFLAFSYYVNYYFTERSNEEEKRLLKTQQERDLKRYYSSKDRDNIEKILSFAEVINCFYEDSMQQRIRSNIFLKEIETGCYRIYAQYNMIRYPDFKLSIPENKGATGDAWLTKNQVWADHQQTFEGIHRLPLEEREKLVKDLQWVCSTPIIRTNSDGKAYTVAVFNIDGNKTINDEVLKKRIQETGQMIADLLQRYDLASLKNFNPDEN